MLGSCILERMNVRVRILILLLAGTSSLVHSAEAADDRAVKEEFFEARVRPLLARKCFECHRRKAEGGLRLDSRKAMLQGGSGGPALVPGNSKKSLIWQVVSGNHEETEMPPDEPLKSGEIKVLQRWIDEGGHWPKPLSSARATPDENGITAEEREFWSFQPVANPKPPKIKGEWGKHPIDAFIAAKHEELGLQPSDRIRSREILRRATYDLTGLPPTPDDFHDFDNQWSADRQAAMRGLLTRLLSSKHYGERWAQHWLDLVRYADTAGDASDFPIPEAYRYRNYVIDAFNGDKPYDQFVREQLAGDLMSTDDEAERWQRIVATGYIAISRRIGVSPHGLRHITIEDTLNNLGKTFLALSVGCARCHDHKFDPIPTADYYALYGIFDSTVYPHAGAEHRPYRSDFIYRMGKAKSDTTLASFREQINTLRRKERAEFEKYRDFQRKPVNIPGYTRAVAWKNVLKVRDEIRTVAETFPDLEIAYAASEGDVGNANIQKQGDPRSRGPVVQRGFLQVLGGQTIADDSTTSGRMELANWIADRKNPLTARVIVNRVWHHHFGKGLVATTSDFGVRGEKPSHPELLDFLATFLMDNGWSIKKLHRLIMTSKTYQSSSRDIPENSAIDPDNKFLWRANRRRLDAEQIRDSILVFSNQLDRSRGGRHGFPHRESYFYRQHEPYVGNFQSNRRTVYLFRQRIRKDRFLDLFDAPDGNLHVGVRRPTTTTLQSLYMMNSDFIKQQSQLIAKRVIDQGEPIGGKVHWAYANIFGRHVGSNEMLATLQKQRDLERQLADNDDRQLIAWTSFVRAMLSSNEFLFID